MWVISRVVGVSAKTVKFWECRCLDAADEWADENVLWGRVWVDQMCFSPGRDAGSFKGKALTYRGRLDHNLYIEIAIDNHGRGFCHAYHSSQGTPTTAMIEDVLRDKFNREAIFFTTDAYRMTGYSETWNLRIQG